MAKLIVANWKMNPGTAAEAAALARETHGPDVVICPPFPFLSVVFNELKEGALGAQDVFWEARGAYTGEVSPAMLTDAAVRYVIVGHSERRALGETDEQVNKKVRAAQAAGLTVILCVGEPKEVRANGLPAAQTYVAEQLKKDLADIAQKVIVAYEPIWAIGTGVADKPEESAAMAKFIKGEVSRITNHVSGEVQVLYGGSVKPDNAASFLSQANIDGALVGGASLQAESFKAIVAAGK